MKRETKYMTILGAVMLLFVVMQLFGPKPLDWTPTFSPTDKNPFGSFVIHQMLRPFFKNKEIVTNNLTFYELKDSIQNHENILSISNGFDPDAEATKVLLNKVANGAHAFISASYFSGVFRDTLGLTTNDVYFDQLATPGGGSTDTTDLKFVIPAFEKKGYYYRLENVSYFFTNLDSMKAQSFIISTNAWNKPVTLRIPWGKGNFIINTTPLAFTNNYLVANNTHEYIEKTLSFLPEAKTWWTGYYQVGRLEAQTPLRFILSNDALRWAYYISILSLILFIVVEARRKQRIIPIVKPLPNTTLEFVKTIGNMYLHANDHKAIAEKKILFFLEQSRSKYYLTAETGDTMVEVLAKKSGNDLQQTQQLFALINVIQNSPSISKQMLMELNKQMEDFTTHSVFA
jgi:hypothetical protein